MLPQCYPNVTSGSRYWLRRRKPAVDRGVDLGVSLGLSDAYHDIFDRIGSRRDAWAVATGQLLLRALEARTMSSRSEGRSVEGGGGGGGKEGGGGRGTGGGRRGAARGGGGGGRGDGEEERGGGRGRGGGEGDEGRGEGDCEKLEVKQNRQLLENCLIIPTWWVESFAF